MLKVVIAYENQYDAVRATGMTEQVAAQLSGRVELESEAWKFELLNYPQALERATDEASKANLIVISVSNTGTELPDHVKTWIENLPPCEPHNQRALVALFDKGKQPLDTSSHVYEYLQQIAYKRDMAFFCNTDSKLPAQPPPSRYGSTLRQEKIPVMHEEALSDHVGG